MTVAAPASIWTSTAGRVLLNLLETRTGQVLTESRAWRMDTALRPVLRDHDLADMDALARHLLRGGDARLEQDVVDALLNNESSFFRDLQIFDMVRHQILPHLRATRPDRVLRIWSAGCATGQEAYSLAICFASDPVNWAGWRIEILATDVSAQAIDQARAGRFSQMDVQRGLGVSDLLTWFQPDGDDWRVSPELRRMIDFRQDNLFDARAPSSDYDLILCRNVLLYFNSPRRRTVLELLASHAHAGSVLLLGAGETVLGQAQDFCVHADFRGAYARTCRAGDQAARSAGG